MWGKKTLRTFYCNAPERGELHDLLLAPITCKKDIELLIPARYTSHTLTLAELELAVPSYFSHMHSFMGLAATECIRFGQRTRRRNRYHPDTTRSKFVATLHCSCVWHSVRQRKSTHQQCPYGIAFRTLYKTSRYRVLLGFVNASCVWHLYPPKNKFSFPKGKHYLLSTTSQRSALSTLISTSKSSSIS